MNKTTYQIINPNDLWDIRNQDNDDMEIDSTSEISIWIKRNGDYTPATNLTIATKIDAGVYKMKLSNDELHITPVTLNSDELYTFSDDLTQPILAEVESFWQKKELYKEYNFIHKRGILLAGSAGSGKTSLITLLCKQLIAKDGIVFLCTTLKEFELYMSYVKDVVRKIEPERPIITVIEDVDKIIESIGDAELLEFLDGKMSIDHNVTIFTSNDTSELSEAFLRPSRIDMHYVIPNPSAEIRSEFLKKKGVPEDHLQEYVDKTNGMSFAELKEIFIGTVILGKSIDDVVKQIQNPTECKNYLDNKKTQKFGL